jgi:hypothetical protein
MTIDRSPGFARLFWLGCLVAVATALTLVVTQNATSADDPGVRPCREAVGVGPLGQRVTCRTASATLTIGEQRMPLVAETTAVRVLRARLSGRSLLVRLRVRNTGASQQRLAADQVYAAVGGRHRAARLRERVVDPHDALNVRVRFVLDRAAAEAVRNGGRTELAVVPWATPRTNAGRRLLVVRLRPES